MKNYKKYLSMTITSAMLFSICVIPTTFARDGADDESEEVEVEVETKAENSGPKREIRPVKAVQNVMRDVRQDVRDIKDGVKQEIKDAREGLKTGIKTERENFKMEAREMRKASSTPEEMKTKREEMRLKIKGEIEAFKEGRKVKLDESKKTRIKAYLAAAFEKLNGAIARLEAFDANLLDAIEKRKSLGLDTTEVEVAIEVAAASLANAKVAVSAISTSTSDAVDTQTEIAKEAIKAQVEKAVSAIKDARSKYQEALKLLPKKVSVEANVNAEVKTN